MNDDDLSRALHDAVSDIEPRDALADIRARTRSDAKVENMSNRTWPLVLLGAVATAAVIGVVAFVGGFGGDGEPDPGPAAATSQPSEPAQPSDSAEPTGPATEQPEPSAPATSDPAPPAAGAVPVYFIGDTERGGPRLYREFQRGSGDPFTAAVDVLTGTPLDPDYRTAWPAGSIEGVGFDGGGAEGVYAVRLADASLADRPAGMSEEEARAAVMQVVYTVQAAGQARAVVGFSADGQRLDTVYGVDTSEPLTHGSMLETLSHMSITTPEQGATASGTLELTGVANSFEASSGWELRRGDEVVRKGAWSAEAWMEDRLFPFQVSIDLEGLAPGDYRVWATTDDPTGGTEGSGAMSDDKDVRIR
ncbi:Gmad2 immunoglobulin-like domain-containing protein [uncultured Nocardioides sp.]|uniref:Gmad2 immunoglobulin-like domain-containing protein n=1 Tax=uncultured Nocardioides sp. TaxID=198441 RepID=UPI0025F4A4CC|nr:Gmad2 immunoglobulin-like domain-containing protein [uncultured Nocardioides sp.]